MQSNVRVSGGFYDSSVNFDARTRDIQVLYSKWYSMQILCNSSIRCPPDHVVAASLLTSAYEDFAQHRQPCRSPLRCVTLAVAGQQMSAFPSKHPSSSHTPPVPASRVKQNVPAAANRQIAIELNRHGTSVSYDPTHTPHLTVSATVCRLVPSVSDPRPLSVRLQVFRETGRQELSQGDRCLQASPADQSPVLADCHRALGDQQWNYGAKVSCGGAMEPR